MMCYPSRLASRGKIKNSSLGKKEDETLKLRKKATRALEKRIKKFLRRNRKAWIQLMDIYGHSCLKYRLCGNTNDYKWPRMKSPDVVFNLGGIILYDDWNQSYIMTIKLRLTILINIYEVAFVLDILSALK